jgi:hypothetical protein
MRGRTALSYSGGCRPVPPGPPSLAAVPPAGSPPLAYLHAVRTLQCTMRKKGGREGGGIHPAATSLNFVFVRNADNVSNKWFA